MGVAPFFIVLLSDDDEGSVTEGVVDSVFFQVTNRRRELDFDELVIFSVVLHCDFRFLLGDFKSSFAIEPPYNVLRTNSLFANRQDDTIAL